METPLGTLFGTQLTRWISAKGFWLVVGAALVPMFLTAAWVGTHQADVAVTDLQLAPDQPLRGDVLNVTATVTNVGDRSVGSFNATVAVGEVQGTRLIPQARNVTVVDGLDPGETRTLHLTWPRTTAGSFWAVAQADDENDVGEKEEANNQEARPFVVEFPEPDPADAPAPPGNLTGSEDANATAEVAVSDLQVTPDGIHPGDQVTVTATVTNVGDEPVEEATARVRLGVGTGGELRTLPGTTRTVPVTDLAPAASQDVTLAWNASLGSFWAQASVAVPDTAHDPDGSDNARTSAVVVQPVADEEPPELGENVTVKGFYLLLLRVLYLPLLLPLIGLFYAGGVLKDEEDAGTLPYLLTRPIPRWLLPTAKWSAGFLVGAAAVAAGILGTFLLLFGLTSAGSITFLTAPLALSLLSLMVYGTLFTTMAILVDRPYLVGIAFTIGWEAIVGNLVPWVQNLTVSFHVLNLLDAWWNAEDLVFRTLPVYEDAWRPFLVLVGAGVGFLVAAGVAMRMREFPDV